MRRLVIIATVLLGAALLPGAGGGPAFAADAGNASKLPNAVLAPYSSAQPIGYKYCDHGGCYYCQRRECDDYYYSYGQKYCKHYTYYDCGPYGGGGGGY